LNPLDFAIWHVLQTKGQAMPHANLDALRPSIIVELDRLAAEYIRKACRSFRRRQEATVAKNGTFIEKMDMQHPNTHQPVLIWANICKFQ
jgi:hypothetical protein